MAGTLALCYDEREAGADVIRDAQRLLGIDQSGAVRPEVELHFNLWRDLGTSVEANFLDIGIRIKSSLQPVKQFYLYVPRPVKRSDLQDLSQTLKFGQTLDAVFNSVIALGDQGDRYYKTIESGRHFTTVHSVDFGADGDIRVENLENDDGSIGSLIVFTEGLCQRIQKQQSDSYVNSYIRFRLYLDKDTSDLFSEEVSVNDKLTVPIIGRLELTEFRLNEKRSYPTRIAELANGGQFYIQQIHYFLIRDLRYELTMQHKPFRKVRRLEGKLWRHYLLPDGVSQSIAEYEHLANRMVIYHWREDAKDNRPVEDFVAFASFRANARNIWPYLFFAVLLGAFGSTLAVGFANLVAWWQDGTLGGAVGWESVLTLVVLLLAALLVLRWVARSTIGPIKSGVARAIAGLLRLLSRLR